MIETQTAFLMKRVLSACVVLILGITPLAGQSARSVARISLTVSSLDEIVPFYEEVLTFRRVDEYQWSGPELQRLLGLSDDRLNARIAVLALGDERIELIEFQHEDRQLPIPADSRSNDLWFQHIAIVVKDMEAAYQRLREFNVQHVSSSPQTLPDFLPVAAGISAFYFRDPDGHNLEIIHFPPGKGDPRWQESTEDLFLGIDHTAIGISDTETSIAFYEELIGLKVAGGSENYGTEQEHLNQVFGAHLVITGLKAQSGAGVEFLDYLAPPGGRPYPADSRATDLWHWQTSIQVDNLEDLYRKLQLQNADIISRGVVTLPVLGLEKTKALMVRDGDGHALLLFQSLKS